MNKKSAYEVYLSVVFKWGILCLVSACMCAAITFTFLKSIGLYPTVSWGMLAVFDTMDVGFFILAALFIRSAFEKGNLKDGKLITGKIFYTIVVVAQWNFIMYMIPSRTFWGFLFFFIVLGGFYLDLKLVVGNWLAVAISQVIGWIVKGDGRLPVKDELFLTDLIICVIAIVLSIVGLGLLIFFMTHFLVNAKKDELEENNRRVEQILVSAQGISQNLMHAGKSLADISTNESASAEELAATSENLLSGSNELSSLSDESVTNLKELIRWGEEVNCNVERVKETSRQLLDISRENEQLLNSLRGINIEVTQSIQETNAVASRLTSSVDEIDNTLKIIGDISESTNLLALNAAIEAARAGEAGRGFSVVANEVGNLANSTQDSLVYIQKIIDNVKQCALEMSSFVTDNANKLENQNESYKNVFEKVSEMIGLLNASQSEIASMGNAHGKQSEVIEQTIALNEQITERIRHENEEFRNISVMVDGNASEISEMSNHIADINQMVEEVNNLLSM